ncbi:MAG TPA: polysaccharide deacetylase family protein, partial [Armatimonadota bacterium]|nr:polysaccharide deacetylase family protein [Armatimonadota bacterium]
GLPVALAPEEDPTVVRQVVAAMTPQPSEAWVASLRERLTQLTQRDPAEREPTLPPGWVPVVRSARDPGPSPAVPRPADSPPPVIESPGPKPVVPIVPRHLKSVALIFDDGPHPLVTPALLRILAEQDVKASFFLVGTQAEQYPELVRRIAQEGHDVGNHTYEHLNLDGLLAPEVQRQMLGGKALLEAILGRPVTYFRAPGENFGPRAQLVASQANLTVIPSSLNTWPIMSLAPEEIARRMASQAQDGSTILLHNGQDKTVYCLEPLIRMLRDAGFEFLTVGQWLQRYPGRAFEAPATPLTPVAGATTPTTGVAAAPSSSAVDELAVPRAGAH